jgi:lactam utilization protein B
MVDVRVARHQDDVRRADATPVELRARHGEMANGHACHALVNDAPKAAEQAVRMAMGGKVRTITGKVIYAPVQSICIHGDSRADTIVAAVRDGLAKAGVIVKPFSGLAGCGEGHL